MDLSEVFAKLVEFSNSLEKDAATKIFNLFEEQNNVSDDGNIDTTLGGFLCALVTQALDGCIKKEALLSVAREIKEKYPDSVSVFADALSFFDGNLPESGVLGSKEDFYSLVKEFEKVLGDSLLKERMDFDTLEAAGVLRPKGSKILNGKYIKLRTKLYFKQHKFNLLREEPEGFAKLIAEIAEKDDQTITEKIQAIRSLIGCFNLDPNRVLDLILEAFEVRTELHAELYVPLIRRYMPEARALSEILGFKFTNFQVGEEKTPRSLYILAVLLLEHKLIRLEDIYPSLYPDDSEIENLVTELLIKAKNEQSRMTKIVIKKDGEIEEAGEKKPEFDPLSYALNQKLGLLEAALHVGTWNIASVLLEKFSADWVMSNPPICQEALTLVHASIEPIYRIYSGLPEASRGMRVKNPLAMSPPPATSFEHLKLCAFPLLKIIGPHGYVDTILLHKIIRLLTAILGKGRGPGRKTVEPPEDTEALYYSILEIVDEFLLPSLSMLDSNCALSDSIWYVIEPLPYNIRYRLYSSWKDGKCDSHPLLIYRKVEQFMRVKRYAKIINKDNVKYMGRVIGKLSHSMPGVLFDYVIYQAQVFELITPFVDSMKFISNLSLDFLAYCLMEALTANRDYFSEDGKSIARWLKASSSMIAQVFAKHRTLDIEPMLQFVANQLKAKKGVFLLILKEIVQKMSGIEQGDEISTAQLEAMAGGELLRSEAAGFFVQQRIPKKTAHRLKDALMDSGLVIPFFSLIAQQVNATVFEENMHSEAKLVQSLYDQCLDTFVQFGSFLSSVLSPEEYQNMIPSLDTLCEQYQLDIGSAFFLYRPIISHSIMSKWEELRRSDKSVRSAPASEKNSRYISIVEGVMAPVIEQVRARLPDKTWEEFSPQFFATFWSLSYSDLYVPSSSYQREIERARKAAMDVMQSQDMTDVKRRKESERLNSLADKLADEEKKQKEHVERVMARLNHEKESWFVFSAPNKFKTEIVIHLLGQCIIPRSLLSEADAAYCAKFVELIHQIKTPNFATLIYYDRLFCDIIHTVVSCSEHECRRYGRFLSMALQIVSRWHADKATYERECSSYPGFITKFKAGGQSGGDAVDQVDYENYRHVCHKWHHKLLKAALVGIESKDYVSERNVLVVLKCILEHFPVQQYIYNSLDKKVEELRVREKGARHDLFTLGQSYLGLMRQRKHLMVREEAFHNKPVRVLPKPVAPAEATVEKNGTQSPSVKKEVEEAAGVNGTPKETAGTKKEAKENKKADRRDDREKPGKDETPKEKRLKLEKTEDGEIPSGAGGEGLDQDKGGRRRHTLKGGKDEAESPRNKDGSKRVRLQATDDDYEEGMIDDKEDRRRRKRDRDEDGGDTKRKRDTDGKMSSKSRAGNGTDQDKRMEKKEARDYDRERRSGSKSRKTGEKRR